MAPETRGAKIPDPCLEMSHNATAVLLPGCRDAEIHKRSSLARSLCSLGVVSLQWPNHEAQFWQRLC